MVNRATLSAQLTAAAGCAVVGVSVLATQTPAPQGMCFVAAPALNLRASGTVLPAMSAPQTTIVQAATASAPGPSPASPAQVASCCLFEYMWLMCQALC